MDNAQIEKIGMLIAKVDAAHSRVDKMEKVLSDSLSDISKELKELNAHMNKGKGWVAALMFLAGGTGAGLVKLLSVIGK